MFPNIEPVMKPKSTGKSYNTNSRFARVLSRTNKLFRKQFLFQFTENRCIKNRFLLQSCHVYSLSKLSGNWLNTDTAEFQFPLVVIKEKLLSTSSCAAFKDVLNIPNKDYKLVGIEVQVFLLWKFPTQLPSSTAFFFW